MFRHWMEKAKPGQHFNLTVDLLDLKAMDNYLPIYFKEFRSRSKRVLRRELVSIWRAFQEDKSITGCPKFVLLCKNE